LIAVDFDFWLGYHMSKAPDMIMKGKYQNSSDIFASCYRPPCQITTGVHGRSPRTAGPPTTHREHNGAFAAATDRVNASRSADIIILMSNAKRSAG
jgi:hypothetical protein